jgi:hypothetical protein
VELISHAAQRNGHMMQDIHRKSLLIDLPVALSDVIKKLLPRRS